MTEKIELVRCVECRHEYELPAAGQEIGCPECGGVSWVSSRIPSDPVLPGHPVASVGTGDA